MNKLLLAVGLLSAGMAVGQNQTTKPSSTTTNTSNYSTTNTENYNSQNATMGTNSSTNKPTSTTGNPNNRTSGGSTSGTRSGTGTSGSYGNSSTTDGMSTGSSNMGTGSNSQNSMGTSGSSTSGSGSYNSTGSTTTPSTSGNSDSNSMGTIGTSTTTPSTSGGYNTNSTGTNNSGTSGGSNTNSMGTGSSTTTPSTNGSYNSNTGSSTSSTYSTQSTTAPDKTKDYKNFAYGVYAGLNSTRFRGESVDTENPAGRIGYQAGFFVRGGGRLYGQIGAEYFASSSNYFRPGDGQRIAAIRDQINVQYIQVPVYIGFKLTESDRGISAIRLQAGVEYANRISSSSGQFKLSNSEIKSGSFNALGQLGFDFGPFLIDLTYHHGLSNAVEITNFQGSSRRILSASIGFKF